MRFAPLLCLLCVLSTALPVIADEASPISSIQDNSFLIEEAYNQEFGVVQHISTFQRQRGEWAYTFTQEWPAPGIRHQLSYTVPLIDTNEVHGIGDVALNYRYQLAGSGETRLAIAPRVSIYLPTGNDSRGLGSGATSFEVNLPVSYVLSDRLASHSNAGAFRDGGSHETTLSVGESLIYALNGRVHLMLESRWAHSAVGDDVVISPGVRWAYNIAGGLQIVPGIAFPRTIGDNAGEQSTFFYLSFEHPFRKLK